MIAKPAAVLLLLAFSNAALHAMIPSHWLSFAVVSRALRWNVRQTLIVTGLAGIGHMLMVVALGLMLARIGKAAETVIPARAEHLATACVLILLGCYFLFHAVRGGGGCHHHVRIGAADDCEGEQSRGLARLGSAPSAMGALAMGITLSPCLELLSLYVAGARLPWQILAGMSLIMAVTTVGLMVLFVWLTLHGLRRLNLRWIERNEGYVFSAILICLGLYLFVIR